MFPYPVKKIDKNTTIKEQDLKKFKYFKYLIENTNDKTSLKISLKKAKSIEGKIMSKADKKVAIKELNNIWDILALVTAKNKNLTKKSNTQY